MLIRVLIADADTNATGYYREQLPRYGFEVETASGGVECVEKLREFAPHVLVLEPSLPWGSGAGVLARMHEDRDVPLVPVIVVTYADNCPSLSHLVPYPVDDYQIKPLTAKRLAERILAVADRPRAEATCQTQPVQGVRR